MIPCTIRATVLGATVVAWSAVGASDVLSDHSHAAQVGIPPTRSPLVAVALRGDIYVVPADGGTPRRLTSYGLNSNPQLSPDGRRVAYLSMAHPYLSGGMATTHGVWVVPTNGPADGSAARELTRPNPALDRGGLAWSPDGRRVAYYEGATIVVGAVDGAGLSVVFRTRTPYRSAASAGDIAWSPDGHRLATLAASAGSRRTSIAVTDMSGKDTTATIVFPPKAPGSAAIGRELSWSADGHSLILDTVTIGAAGGRITGVWRVAANGGLAHLVQGQSVYDAPLAKGTGGAAAATDAALDGATTLAVSPDRRYLATNPVNIPAADGPVEYRLWVADANGRHGRAFPTSVGASGCALTQFAWLPTSTDIALVSVCGASDTGTMVARLSSISIAGSNATLRVLYSLSYTAGKGGTPFDSIDLAPVSRHLGG